MTAREIASGCSAENRTEESIRQGTRGRSDSPLANGECFYNEAGLGRNFQRKSEGEAMIAALLLQGSGGAPGLLGSPLVMMIIVMGIFYVMLFLPQQRQRKKTQAMLAALKNGDKVVTTGGIYGTVNGLDGDTVILKIADQVKIRILRSAIAQVEVEPDAK